MRLLPSTRPTTESSDDVGLIVALLTRFPEIATITAHPLDGTLELSFVVRRRLDRAAETSLHESAGEHVRALLGLRGAAPARFDLFVQRDEHLSVVQIVRDAATVTREELVLLTALLRDRFGEGLVTSPAAPAAPEDEDSAAQDELVDFALEALRDPEQQKSLVGYREERGVLVYYMRARRRKARGR
jgi:hypothetical protein